MKRSIGTLLTRSLSYLILIIAVLITIVPFLYMLSTAFKGQIFVFEYPPRFIPTEPTWRNFVSAWTSNRFERYFLNSVIVTCASVVGVVSLASMMAYAFARLDFAFKRLLYSLVMLFMMIPLMALIVPQFILAVKWQLLNQLSGLILVYIAQNLPLSIFLLTGFFKQIPRELEESARMDGASSFTIYRHIILPLSKPALATAIIFSSLGAWDEYVWAVTIINDPQKRTLPVGIAAFQGVHASDWGLIFAASIIAILPIILVYIFLQRYFIKGILTGAVKG